MEDLALDRAALQQLALLDARRSSRAASSAWIVGGTATVPCSRASAAISSRNSGLPSLRGDNPRAGVRRETVAELIQQQLAIRGRERLEQHGGRR